MRLIPLFITLFCAMAGVKQLFTGRAYGLNIERSALWLIPILLAWLLWALLT